MKRLACNDFILIKESKRARCGDQAPAARGVPGEDVTGGDRRRLSPGLWADRTGEAELEKMGFLRGVGSKLKCKTVHLSPRHPHSVAQGQPSPCCPHQGHARATMVPPAHNPAWDLRQPEEAGLAADPPSQLSHPMGLRDLSKNHLITPRARGTQGLGHLWTQETPGLVCPCSAAQAIAGTIHPRPPPAVPREVTFVSPWPRARTPVQLRPRFPRLRGGGGADPSPAPSSRLACDGDDMFADTHT